ncbi:hypothetical protein PIB30_029115, partial [Stylosanthes scabra]|nr:hypothetical protein [Stylosanthes scabra]
MDFGFSNGDDGDESSGYCSLESEPDSELFPDEEDANDLTGVGDTGGDDSYHCKIPFLTENKFYRVCR